MYKNVTVAQASLIDSVTAPKEIDRVLRMCWVKSRPVYIQLPMDMITKTVDGIALEEPIDLSLPQDKNVEIDVLGQILEELYSSKRPCILVDGFGIRRQVCSNCQFAQFIILNL